MMDFITIILLTLYYLAMYEFLEFFAERFKTITAWLIFLLFFLTMPSIIAIVVILFGG
jgi:hypothetical protein